MTDNIESIQSKQSDKGESQISGNPGEASSKEDAHAEFLKDFVPNTIGGFEGTSVPDQQQDLIPNESEALPNVIIEKEKNVEKKHESEEKDRIIFSPEDGIDIYRNDESEQIESIPAEKGELPNFHPQLREGFPKDFLKDLPEVSQERKDEAKETLANEISDLIPAKDRETLKSMQSALVDGDLKAFSKVVKDSSGDPEKLNLLVKELNKQINDNERFGGIEVQLNKGNVLMYSNRGGTALKIDSKTGEASIHPVKTQLDGSVVMLPGEIINKEPDDVMKSLGDETARSLTTKFVHAYGNNLRIGENFYQKPLGSSDGSSKHKHPGQIRPYYDGNNESTGKPSSSSEFLRGFTDESKAIVKGFENLLGE